MRNQKLQHNQAGIVSFVVVIVIMFVLTLIVLAFAQLVRREQRQTLDRQLNTQAFYAAESGINDALNAMNNPAFDFTRDYTADCNEFITTNGLNPTIDNNISYSCLLVDPSPADLDLGIVPITASKAISLQTKTGTPISSLQISWEDDPATGRTTVTGCPNPASINSFPATMPATCQIGSVRLEVVPFPAVGGRTRAQLILDRMVAFLHPRPGAGSAAVPYATGSGYGNQGLKVAGACNTATTPRDCNVTITGLNITNGYLRLRSLYYPTAVTILPTAGDGSALELIGAQVDIDVTGKANDILKRIKVRAPIGTGSDLFPEFGLQSVNTVCKRFSITTVLTPDTAEDPACDPHL